jgi:S1/P1 Nuclease
LAIICSIIMKVPIVRLFVLAAALLSKSIALAWNGHGHMVVAAEAYRELSPEMQQKVSEILKSHPDYAKWEKAHSKIEEDIDLPGFVFLQASMWPDQIHNQGNEYDHPAWHTIHYPLKPPGFPMEPAEKPNNNALFGIAECEKALSDSKTSPRLRAVYLSFLIHLVGDLHQPLHCGSFFNADFPDGDRGAYDFFVKAGDKGVRLHVFWDGLPGKKATPQACRNNAVEIETKYPRKSLTELSEHTTPKEWSLEGRALAIDKGYLHGELKGSTSAETAFPLPDGYTTAAKAVAERRVALAGYRLADEIRQYVK